MSDDCQGDTPIFDDSSGSSTVLQRNEVGVCRAPKTSAECADAYGKDRNFYDASEKTCRATQSNDCTDSTPVFENGECRPREESDCIGDTPVLDTAGYCRARQPTDCKGDTPVFDNKECRAPKDSAECADAYGRTQLLRRVGEYVPSHAIE